VDQSSGKEACCKGIIEVRQQDNSDNINDDSTDQSSLFYQRCVAEIALVPSSIESATMVGNTDDSAKFSWMVSKTFESVVKSTSIEQFLWESSTGDGNNQFQRVPTQTVTPYHKTRFQPPMQNSSQPIITIATKLDSHLSRDGGMHRLFYHKFQSFESNDGEDDPNYLIYLTIPKGMFIDLDDPIESTTGSIQSLPTENNGAVASVMNHGFVVTASETRKSSVLSFRARLHAATVCDIEQPAFVSGQHLLIWEIDNIVTRESDTTPAVIEFATKLHLRYPHPSSTLEEWIELPSPLLFTTLKHYPPKSSEGYEYGYNWDLDSVDRIWVAAGNDEDHFWIMCMTISFCLIGVVIMLRDISKVSLWDDL